MFCHFTNFAHSSAAPTAGDIASLTEVLRGVPGLAKALIHTASATNDPYLHDGAPPALVVQSYFADITALEAACARAGAMQALSGVLPGAGVTQQAMVARSFPVPDPRFLTPAGEPHCTYLVAYEGSAEDINLWLSHYIAHHLPIMANFPSIRQIEIYTRLDWCGFLPFPRLEFMQRNKVVFDSPDALTAALNSPVRHEMRADFKEFPSFSGGNTHYPMLTWEVTPSGADPN
jgi:hypothetical protein